MSWDRRKSPEHQQRPRAEGKQGRGGGEAGGRKGKQAGGRRAGKPARRKGTSEFSPHRGTKTGQSDAHLIQRGTPQFHLKLKAIKQDNLCARNRQEKKRNNGQRRPDARRRIAAGEGRSETSTMLENNLEPWAARRTEAEVPPAPSGHRPVSPIPNKI